jgi:hypothetical protein
MISNLVVEFILCRKTFLKRVLNAYNLLKTFYLFCWFAFVFVCNSTNSTFKQQMEERNFRHGILELYRRGKKQKAKSPPTLDFFNIFFLSYLGGWWL